MSTITKPDTWEKQSQRRATLNNIANIAQAVLFISGAAQLLLGAFIWTGEADQWIPVHELIGLVLVLSLWTIAAIAARFGVSIGLIAASVGLSVVAPILGTIQEALLEGDWHWTVQVVHVMIGIGVIVCGRILMVSMKRTSL